MQKIEIDRSSNTSARTITSPARSGLLFRVLLLSACFLGSAAYTHAQGVAPTAIRRSSLQVGIGYSLADSDYSQKVFRGGSVYGTYNITTHLGAEFMVHQVNTQYDNNIYERTYELGPRYVLHYGRFEPFVRVAYGRGVFNYPYNGANLAYNMFTVAGGADIRLSRHIYARGEYEVQRWLNFPPHGLQPTVTTLGAAYRF